MYGTILGRFYSSHKRPIVSKWDNGQICFAPQCRLEESSGPSERRYAVPKTSDRRPSNDLGRPTRVHISLDSTAASPQSQTQISSSNDPAPSKKRPTRVPAASQPHPSRLLIVLTVCNGAVRERSLESNLYLVSPRASTLPRSQVGFIAIGQLVPSTSYPSTYYSVLQASLTAPPAVQDLTASQRASMGCPISESVPQASQQSPEARLRSGTRPGRPPARRPGR